MAAVANARPDRGAQQNLPTTGEVHGPPVSGVGDRGIRPPPRVPQPDDVASQSLHPFPLRRLPHGASSVQVRLQRRVALPIDHKRLARGLHLAIGQSLGERSIGWEAEAIEDPLVSADTTGLQQPLQLLTSRTCDVCHAWRPRSGREPNTKLGQLRRPPPPRGTARPDADAEGDPAPRPARRAHSDRRPGPAGVPARSHGDARSRGCLRQAAAGGRGVGLSVRRLGRRRRRGDQPVRARRPRRRLSQRSVLWRPSAASVLGPVGQPAAGRRKKRGACRSRMPPLVAFATRSARTCASTSMRSARSTATTW